VCTCVEIGHGSTNEYSIIISDEVRDSVNKDQTSANKPSLRIRLSALSQFGSLVLTVWIIFKII